MYNSKIYYSNNKEEAFSLKKQLEDIQQYGIKKEEFQNLFHFEPVYAFNQIYNFMFNRSELFDYE